MNDISPYLTGILLSLSAGVLALLSPGPNVMAVISTSISVGRSYGAALATGVAAGALLWALLAVSGLTVMVNTYAGVLTALKIVGGLYLLWLGYKSLESAFTPKIIEPALEASNDPWLDYFVRGFTVQMTNPKSALAMTAIVTIGIQGQSPTWVSVVLVAGISLLSLVGHLLYAFLFSTRTVVHIYIKSRRWIESALGAFFCFAGIKLLVDRS